MVVSCGDEVTFIQHFKGLLPTGSLHSEMVAAVVSLGFCEVSSVSSVDSSRFYKDLKNILLQEKTKCFLAVGL